MIFYIIYSFFALFILYICFLIYKRYSFIIFAENEIITSEKINSKKNNKCLSSYAKKINNAKKHLKIKSTEKTYNENIFVSQKPKYINFSENINFDIANNLTISDNFNKSCDNSKIAQNITKIYLSVKQKYYNTFINKKNNNYYINNLIEFNQFHKNNLCTDLNILIKFYNSDIANNNKYIFMFVNGNQIIKITQSEKYDKITSMIEQNGGIFLLENEKINNEYYVCYGSYIQSKTNQDEIKNIFFTNISDPKTNKNYQLLSKYNLIKIYFYISGKFVKY